MGWIEEESKLLNLPWHENLAFSSRMLLWRGPPPYDGLEGFVVLEIEPGQWLETGLVWLSRELNSASAAVYDPPTDYLCQSKELLDRRNKIWVP